jgi:hypothetical protein
LETPLLDIRSRLPPSSRWLFPQLHSPHGLKQLILALICANLVARRLITILTHRDSLASVKNRKCVKVRSSGII